MHGFEDLLVWQKAEALTVSVYKLFKPVRDYAFADQIQRASVSIVCNIAEGYERKGSKEFGRFLIIAKGSAGEVRALSHLATKLGYLDKQRYDELCAKSLEISRMISGLIKKL